MPRRLVSIHALARGASTRDDFYNGAVIKITGGTGSPQTNKIVDYDGATQTATVKTAWGTTPDNTSVFDIAASVCPELVEGEASVGKKIADCG